MKLSMKAQSVCGQKALASENVYYHDALLCMHTLYHSSDTSAI